MPPTGRASTFVRPLLLALVGAAFVVASAAPLAAQGAPEATSPQRFGSVPPFSFVERSGRTVTLDDLLGAPWVAVPFFVSCTGPCPNVTTDLRSEVLEALRGTSVRIVSFSVDPDVDTPERLREYADRYGLGDEPQWLFLTGERAAIDRFVLEGLKVPLARSEEAAAEYGQSITHGTRLAVVDAEGRIAGWYEASRQVLGEGLGDGLALLRERALALAAPAGGSRLPQVNAVLNGTAAVLLLLGWLAIRAGRRERHARLMVAAFLVSAAFLTSYLYYHLVVQRTTGPVRYRGTGLARSAYLALLLTHVVGAIVNLPMVLRTLFLAHKGAWDRHRRLARRTFPLWLYVSVTGVLVYLVLYPWNPPPTP